MSTLPGNTPGASGRPRKQPADVYTVMLIVSFIALLIACILMSVELGRYGEFPYWDTREAQPAMRP